MKSKKHHTAIGEKYTTFTGAARYLHVSQKTLQAMITVGQLKLLLSDRPIKDVVVRCWVERGLLTVVATRGIARYFDKAAVDQFAADHIYSEEAGRFLGVGPLTMQKWARAGRLVAVSGPGVDGCHRWLFRREDVEQLGQSKLLTGPEMAARLGISKSTLTAWVKSGKVQPVSGPGIDGTGHYLFVIPPNE